MNVVSRVLLAIALNVFMGYAVADTNNWDAKHILVLHSYEPSYQWTADFQKGIDSALALSGVPIKVSIEYLDTKRINSPEYFSKLRNYLSFKYKNYDFDGVIATDDNALRFLRGLDMIAGKNIPVVAAGINDTSESLHSITHKGTVIYEKDDIDSNIDLIVKLQPNLKKLYYLADRSLTSELIRGEVINILSKYDDIELVEIRERSLSEASQFLSGVSKDDAVLLTHFNTEIKQNRYYSYQEISHIIAGSSAAPVFSLWEFYIQGGVLGGYVNRSESMGIEAVKALSQYIPLRFEAQVVAGSNKRIVFDYDALATFDISMFSLPAESILLNSPTSFIKDNYRLLIASSVVIAFLTTIIIMQFATIRQKRELANKNKKILTLQSRTLGVQKEMIHVLGEAIETRSGETGNHVKRVAKLSAKLAKLKGLSHREIEIIEIISPMHDVGKISVPESILDKPGQLNEEEWKVMKQHTTAGYKLLKTSEGDITNLAAIVAHEHHERWDGKGYPNGKVGEDIHIFARITAVADVFDALLSVRCYKQAWPVSDVVELFERETGFQFDPCLTKLLIQNIDDFISIRDLYPDSTSD